MFSSRIISSQPGEFSMVTRVWLAVFATCEIYSAAVELWNSRPQCTCGQVKEDIASWVFLCRSHGLKLAFLRAKSKARVSGILQKSGRYLRVRAVERNVNLYLYRGLFVDTILYRVFFFKPTGNSHGSLRRLEFSTLFFLLRLSRLLPDPGAPIQAATIGANSLRWDTAVAVDRRAYLLVGADSSFGGSLLNL